MLPYIIRALFIVFFVIIPCSVFAKHPISLSSVMPTTLYLGMDVAKMGAAWYQKTGNAYEINGCIDWKRVLLNGDYGWGQIRRDGGIQGSLSHTEGHYFRVGLDWNFLAWNKDSNQFFIGFRYARALFNFQSSSDKLRCNHPSDHKCVRGSCYIGRFIHKEGSGAGAQWWEVVAGAKVRLISLASIGCTVRYKRSLRLDHEEGLEAIPFDIPGFGLNDEKDKNDKYAFGYSLYIFFRIPLQKNRKEISTKKEVTLMQ